MKCLKRMKGIRVGIIALVFLLGFTLQSSAFHGGSPGDHSAGEGGSYLVMERARDWLDVEPFKILEDARDRVEELTDSIGRGAKRIEETVDRLTDFIGFGDPDSREESGENTPPGDEESREERALGQVRGTFTTKEGEPVESVRVNLGNYATYTNAEGDFVFEEIPYGVYTLSYQPSENGRAKPVEEILLDRENNRYVVNLVIEGDSFEEAPGEEEEEVLVESVSRESGEEQGLEEAGDEGGIPGFIFLLALVLLALVLFFRLNRKHIKVIDAQTGESLGKKKVEIKTVTWIDLTEEFQEASAQKIRIRFIRSALRKLCGKKVMFTVEDRVIAQIPEYTGELDFLIRKKIPQESPESASQEESGDSV